MKKVMYRKYKWSNKNGPIGRENGLTHDVAYQRLNCSGVFHQQMKLSNMASLGFLAIFSCCIISMTVAVGPYDLEIKLSKEDLYTLKNWAKDGNHRQATRLPIHLKYSTELNLPQDAFDCANKTSKTWLKIPRMIEWGIYFLK